ncbi:CDC40 [Mytilus coruscus]|uniref:CDC40 n=1 Tax=Mytilus coruscus TaxID=42192 RepID=A0A6J8EBJ3_MYTCO|nr:CDC40 [Mytilus coruscus]
MKWKDLDLSFEIEIKKWPAPNYIFIHLGASEFGLMKSKELIENIKCSILRIKVLAPDIKIIWSDILPRPYWHGTLRPKLIEIVRKRVNCAKDVLVSVQNVHASVTQVGISRDKNSIIGDLYVMNIHEISYVIVNRNVKSAVFVYKHYNVNTEMPIKLKDLFIIFENIEKIIQWCISLGLILDLTGEEPVAVLKCYKWFSLFVLILSNSEIKFPDIVILHVANGDQRQEVESFKCLLEQLSEEMGYSDIIIKLFEDVFSHEQMSSGVDIQTVLAKCHYLYGDADGKRYVRDREITKLYSKFKALDDVCAAVLWYPRETLEVASCGWDGVIKYWNRDR